MTRLSDILLKLALMAAAFMSAALLLRDALAIGLHVPLDPNEGWNAYHALAAMAGTLLYPQPPDLMANNYPPLSFYLVGALTRLTGDAIIAGRLVSLAAFIVTTVGLMTLLRQLGANVLASLFSGLVFAATLLIASNYVAMDDPQLLGHALQIQALLLLLRPKPATLAAALLMAAGVFVKHNLVAMPLAAAIWLWDREPRQAVRFILIGLGIGLAGLAGFRLVTEVNLPHEIFSPRLFALANFEDLGLRFLSWAALPILATTWLSLRFAHDRWVRFAVLYAGIAIVLGGAFAAGDGVDANMFFDAAIALALSGGLALTRFAPRYAGLIAAAYVVPLAVLLGSNFHDGNFVYREMFRRQAAPDIAFIALHRGPAACEDLALCYWADKEPMVDVFNMSEAFAAGARSDADLVRRLQAREFSTLEFYSLTPFALGPKVRATLLANYRVDHEDDNGAFLVRRSSE
jgi:hypothetical protein